DGGAARHPQPEIAREKEEGLDVDGQDRVPVLLRDLRNRDDADDPGGVDQAVGLAGGVVQALTIVGPGQVARDRLRTRSRRAGEALLVDVDREHVAAALAEEDRGRLADAARGA